MIAAQYRARTVDRRSVLYRARLPDGTLVEKKSFNVQTEIAFLGCYQHQGHWYVSGIVTEPKDWGDHVFVEARRK